MIDPVKKKTTDPVENKKAGSGDKLPTYTKKTIKTTATSIKGTKKVKGKKVTKNMDKERSTYNRQVDPSKITPAMTKAANARVKAAKSLDAAASIKSVEKNPGSQTITSSVKSETNTIGNQTLNQVKKKGVIATSNRMDLARAKTEAAITKGTNDSIGRANKYLGGIKGKVSPGHITKATQLGNSAGKKALKDSGMFSRKESNDLFNTNYGGNSKGRSKKAMKKNFIFDSNTGSAGGRSEG